MDDNNKVNDNENMPVAVDGDGEVAERANAPAPEASHELIRAQTCAEVQEPIIREYDAGQEYDGMRGGFASVKGNRVYRSDNRLVWIVLVVMCIMCIAVGVCSSLLTAHFMRKGEQPTFINVNGEIQQNVAAVVAARKPSVVEITCGGSRGSGIVMKRDGNNVYVMTNAHLLEQYVSIKRKPGVRFYGEDTYYEATVAGYVEYYDVAVLVIAYDTKYSVYDLDGSEYFSPNNGYAEGDYVVSIGNAMSMGIASYHGIISRESELLECNNLFNVGGKKNVPVTRTTAVINAGMSGGGVFDMKGNLVGMGTYRMSNSAGVDEEGVTDADVEDTGFFVPISVLYPIYKSILADANGGEASVFPLTVKKSDTSRIGWIGLPMGFNCEYKNGELKVVTRDQNAPSDKVQVGDVIVAVGDSDVSDNICDTIGAFLSYRRSGGGKALRLTLLRDGERVSVTFEEYGYAV